MKPNRFVKTCVALYGPTGWQAALAKDIDVDPSSVRRWTAGTVPVPGPVVAFLHVKSVLKNYEDAAANPSENISHGA